MTPAEIRTRREALGMTQSEAAELFGVTMRTWRYWEAEGPKAMPRAAQLVLMALAEVPSFRRWLNHIADQRAA